ncbi:MAG: hypothetical protein KAR47_03960 [Planctomycetes bacterium]|nr:hypothetical protein [Planctomycetota bacterium]
MSIRQCCTDVPKIGNIPMTIESIRGSDIINMAQKHFFSAICKILNGGVTSSLVNLLLCAQSKAAAAVKQAKTGAKPACIISM